MSTSRTPPPGGRKASERQTAAAPAPGPSIRRLGDDPHRVVQRFFGHLEQVAAPPQKAQRPRARASETRGRTR